MIPALWPALASRPNVSTVRSTASATWLVGDVATRRPVGSEIGGLPSGAASHCGMTGISRVDARPGAQKMVAFPDFVG